jgi:hypothetical protein
MDDYLDGQLAGQPGRSRSWPDAFPVDRTATRHLEPLVYTYLGTLRS